MAGSVNKVILIGNLGRDPQVRRMSSGEAVVNFSVATTESWRDKASGERKDKTEWHVEGQLQTRKWADKDGAEKYTTEVVLQRYRGELTLMDSRNSGGDSGGRDEGGGSFERSSGNASFGRSSPFHFS